MPLSQRCTMLPHIEVPLREQNSLTAGFMAAADGRKA